MPSVLAIDPGLSGALAAYDGENLFVADIPVRAAAKRTVLDLTALCTELTNLWTNWSTEVADAVVERVGAMPRQGLSSAFNFGFTTGAIHGVLAAYGYTVEVVTPQTWKFQVGLNAQPGADTKARKNASRALAQQLFPNHAHLFARVKDDGRAEAALMAWWFIHRRKA